MLRTIPVSLQGKTNMFAKTELVTVRGSIKDGRLPYIQLDRVHYTSNILKELGNLIGQKILVEIDDDDFRQVKAYLPNGAELGFLTAKGRWSVTKHSRRTRKAINSLLAKRIITLSDFDDPVHVFLDYLSTTKSREKH